MASPKLPLSSPTATTGPRRFSMTAGDFGTRPRRTESEEMADTKRMEKRDDVMAKGHALRAKSPQTGREFMEPGIALGNPTNGGHGLQPGMSMASESGAPEAPAERSGPRRSRRQFPSGSAQPAADQQPSAPRVPLLAAANPKPSIVMPPAQVSPKPTSGGIAATTPVKKGIGSDDLKGISVHGKPEASSSSVPSSSASSASSTSTANSSSTSEPTTPTTPALPPIGYTSMKDKNMAAESSVGGPSSLPPRAGSPTVSQATAQAPGKKRVRDSADYDPSQRGQRRGRGGRNQTMQEPDGFSGFVDWATAQGTLQGSNAKTAAKFNKGPLKGKQYGEGVEFLREKWKKMSPEQRQPYIDRVTGDDVRTESPGRGRGPGRGRPGRVAQNEAVVDGDEGGPKEDELEFDGNSENEAQLSRPMIGSAGLEFNRNRKFSRNA